jgi:hypothetical protein
MFHNLPLLLPAVSKVSSLDTADGLTMLAMTQAMTQAVIQAVIQVMMQAMTLAMMQ